jgi:hypothetical protein
MDVTEFIPLRSQEVRAIPKEINSTKTAFSVKESTSSVKIPMAAEDPLQHLRGCEQHKIAERS